MEQGERLLSQDPLNTGLSNEMAGVQTGWEELLRLLSFRRNELSRAKIVKVNTIVQRLLVAKTYSVDNKFFHIKTSISHMYLVY